MSIDVSVYEVKGSDGRRVLAAQSLVSIGINVDAGYNTKKLQLFRERLEKFINEQLGEALKEE